MPTETRTLLAEVDTMEKVNDATSEFNSLINEIRNHHGRGKAVRVTVERVSATDVRRGELE